MGTPSATLDPSGTPPKAVRAALRLLALGALLLLSAGLVPHASAGDDAALIGLREAVARGIRSNLDLSMIRLEIPIREQDATSAEAAFDPVVEAALSAGDEKILTGVILYDNEVQHNQEIGAGAGVLKRFTTGLRSRLAFETRRTGDNFLADTLDPKYRNLIVLELTQPLLRDFGREVNTAPLREAKNRVDQAVAGYMGRAQALGARIEETCLDLAGASAVLAFRIQGRELASELRRGNERRLAQGMISVTEVDEARAAEVDREEAVIQARQLVETLSNGLRDLLEIGPDDPLYGAELRTPDLPAGRELRPEHPEALRVALARRPDLKEAMLARDGQEILAEYYRNQKKPRVDLVAAAGGNGLSGGDRPVGIFGDPRTSSLTGDYGDAFSSMIEDGGYQLSAALRFHYPPGNRDAVARYEKSRLMQRRLDLLIERTKHRIDTEIQNALVAVDRGLERVRAGERFARLSEKTLDQETARLGSGLSDTFRVLEYQEKAVAARIRHITALTGYHKGLARLYQAMGINLERLGILASVDEGVLGFDAE